MSQKTPVEARPASTVLLLRDSAPGALEVFMVERHHKMDFAAAARVFPGGRVDEADVHLGGSVEASFRVAAIREAFEESGILLARPKGDVALIAANRLDALQHAREPLNVGQLDFGDFLNAESLTLAEDLLVPFAHWITPVVYPKRYDTLFFLARAPDDQTGAHDGYESVDSLWISPARALADADAGKCKLEFATRRNLEKLARSTSTKDAINSATKSKVVRVLPTTTGEGESMRVSIPAEADYGGTDFSMWK